MSDKRFYLDHIYSLLQYELAQKEAELIHLPKGNLYTKPRNDGLHLCWSRQPSQNTSGKRKQKMLSEANRNIAEGVQRQQFLNEQIPRLRHNLQWVGQCRENYQLCDDDTIRSILPNIYTSPLLYCGFHQSSPRTHSQIGSSAAIYPQGLIHKNSIGELFRSKAEVAISEILRQMNISYVYEAALRFDWKTIYPDFMLDIPGLSSPKYIEYFGMVGHEEYNERMVEKIQLYLENGFIPGIHVLFLYESPGSGFDLFAISKVIQQFAATSC